ncbi:MAG: PH domain-containing protein [Roseiflexus sp.]|nr:PH domain-containing protein [Roseiflexus sp.]MCS7290920.1 PH domain-containing protein [Roseiflexus sp.]MDW8147124.1 PH domain-containing protein [Roseiflexaceae bacterium]MDW8231688.1 PH domain-containing protein [Roseiflexaceae bacterium]
MKTIDPLLGRGERVRYIGRQHVFVLISNILTELMLIGVLVAAGVVSQVAFPDKVLAGMEVGVLVLIVCVIISLLVLGSAFLDYLRWMNEQCVVTDRRVILLRGIFNIEAIDIPIEKINEVELRQSWLGRLFSFGDVEIMTASEPGVSRCRSLADPYGFKRAMNDARSDIERGYAYIDQHDIRAYLDPDVSLPDVGCIAHALQHLADMRDRGLISREEFEEKKRELLNRI